MDFLKKNYEKILLALVLLGLAVSVVFLLFKIGSDKQALDDRRNSLINPKVKPLPGLDLTNSESALKRLGSPAMINFSEPHRLFNPMPWQQKADGTLIPGSKVGPTAATVTNLTKLFTRITLDDVISLPDSVRYKIGVQKEAATAVKDRAKRQTYCSLNSKNEWFTLVEIKGKPEEPTQLILQLNDNGERVAVSKERAYERVDSYMADIKYDIEPHAPWRDKRIGAVLRFNGEDYTIVVINQNEVVLSAKSNQKKWTIPYNNNNPGQSEPNTLK
jgi:hypothetical protein